MGLTPTTPHLWQVMNSAKPSVELLDAVYILSHALSLKTAGAYTNLTVQLQPSVNNHATFTDSPSEVSTCTMCSNRPPCEDKEKKELVITLSPDRISQECLKQLLVETYYAMDTYTVGNMIAILTDQKFGIFSLSRWLRRRPHLHSYLS